MAGLTVGAAATLAGSPAAFGQWVPHYQNYTIQRLGLYGAPQTGSGGLQLSWPSHINSAGHVAGNSSRYTGINTSNGQDAWVWNGAGTQQVGLTGGLHAGSLGYQVSQTYLQNDAGQVAGYSSRISGVSTFNGQNSWIWNGASTQQVGLVGVAHTGSAGFQYSVPLLQNVSGRVAGTSNRYTGVNTSNGRDAWVWNGTTTQQIGLTGGANTGSAGFQVSDPEFQNAAGQVVGSSRRYTGVNTDNGLDAWVWNGTTTQQIGLTGGAHTGSAGYQLSAARLQNSAGQVSGYSFRFAGVSTDNGLSAWVWNGTTTQQIGLVGGAYTGSAGYQVSEPRFQNEAGQVAGWSSRITGVNTVFGQDAWVWNGTTTQQVGFTGGVYLGSNGFQSSSVVAQNASGMVAGFSARRSGTSPHGNDSWIWHNGSIQQVGLTGGSYTGSGGFQASTPVLLNAMGRVAGYSNRYSDASTYKGRDAWVFDGATTHAAGLSGGAYTGSAGWQYSEPTLQSAAGHVAGYTYRISGASTQIGLSAWYFDPATNLSHEILGSVRTSDNYAYSYPSILTEGGFLLGRYSFFSGGVDPAQDRAFIFRPDLGLTDLGALVNGGLGASGWSTLFRPDFSVALNYIVGSGLVTGQASGGQSVFLMVPAPASAALLGLGGLLGARRRR